MAGFDFSKAKADAAAAEEGTPVAINDPDGTPYDPPLTITVAGMLSDRVRLAQSRNGFAFAAKRDAAGDDPERSLDVVAETVDVGTREVAARATLAWDGLTADGQDVPCTVANARELYRVAPHILTQVLRAMRSREAAFRGGNRAADGVDDVAGGDGEAERETDATATPGRPRTTRRRTGAGASDAPGRADGAPVSAGLVA
jgi:hypothetical protein